MKAGDMVRFRTKSKSFFSRYETWETGLLIEYHNWEKIATIMYEGNLYRIPASNVQKSGKKDLMCK